MKKNLFWIFVSVLFFSVFFNGTTVEAISFDKVVYLINGSLGDNSFYDSGQAGIDQLKKDYGVEARTIECGFDAGKYLAFAQLASVEFKPQQLVRTIHKSTLQHFADAQIELGEVINGNDCGGWRW